MRRRWVYVGSPDRSALLPRISFPPQGCASLTCSYCACSARLSRHKQRLTVRVGMRIGIGIRIRVGVGVWAGTADYGRGSGQVQGSGVSGSLGIGFGFRARVAAEVLPWYLRAPRTHGVRTCGSGAPRIRTRLCFGREGTTLACSSGPPPPATVGCGAGRGVRGVWRRTRKLKTT